MPARSDHAHPSGDYVEVEIDDFHVYEADCRLSRKSRRKQRKLYAAARVRQMTAWVCFECDHRWVAFLPTCPACGGSGEKDPDA